MARYKFTDKAERDLEAIIDYTLQQWGADQTHRYITGLEDHSQLLAENPELGIMRDSISDGLRSFPYASHVLYYVSAAHGIIIVRVLHQSMDPVQHL